MLGRGRGRRRRERDAARAAGGAGRRRSSPACPPELVRLGLWVADDYCSTPARGLALVLPPGHRDGARRAAPAARTRELLVAELTPAGSEALADRRAGCAWAQRQRRPWRRLLDGPATAAELRGRGGADHGALRRLADRGLIVARAREPLRRPSPASSSARRRSRAPATGAPPLTLTAAQHAALDAVLAAAARAPPRARSCCTASRAAARPRSTCAPPRPALEQGRSAIVLVPEIALTPQTARRFRERFGDRVAVLHSQLGLGERYDEWQRLRRGEARVCVGPRSAVFAPLRDLGPDRGRRGARLRLQAGGRSALRRAPCGRAARRAGRRGAVCRQRDAAARELAAACGALDLPERVDGRAAAAGRAGRHARACGTRSTAARARRSTRSSAAAAKAIVLVNRRGWSPFVVCRACGHDLEVPALRRDADASPRAAHAQGCSAITAATREPVPGICPECRSTAVARHGTGTQRLEAELARGARAAAGVPARRRRGPAQERDRRTCCDGFERARGGHPRRHADGRPGPRLPGGRRWRSCRTPTRRCASPTSARRSARSRWSRSSPAAAAAAPRAAACSCRRCVRRSRCLRHAARHDAAALPGGGARAPARARLPAVRRPGAGRHVGAATQAAADAAASGVRRALEAPALEMLGPGAALPPQGPLPQHAADEDAPSARPRSPRSARRCSGGRRARRSRGVAFAVDVDPQ